MTKLFGGLCYAAFCITAMAYLAEPSTQLETEVTKSSPVYCSLAEQNKAVSLIAVTSATCGPCKRLKKETLPVLEKEGYQVDWVSFRMWRGPKVDRVPTLFYYDSDNNIVITEIGFKTPKEIKQKLRKP